MANRKFSQKQLDALDLLDPEIMVKQMKSDYESVARQQPEMAGKINDQSFDLTKKSTYFLKAAAKQLTVYQISQVYACGFFDILKAREKTAMDKAIREAIQAMKDFTALGGDERLLELRIMGNNPPLELKENVDILNQTKGNDDIDDAKVMHFNSPLKQFQDIDPFISTTSSQGTSASQAPVNMCWPRGGSSRRPRCRLKRFCRIAEHCSHELPLAKSPTGLAASNLAN